MLDIPPFTNASSESSFRNQEGKKTLAGRRRRQRIAKLSNNKEGRNDKERRGDAEEELMMNREAKRIEGL